MSKAKLNIWISEMDNPCKISNRVWYVTIYNCDGKPLEWCNKRYTVLPAKCGHLELDIPPGCYRINALWSGIIPGHCGISFFPVNRFTDSAVVQACCGEETCVTLFSASARRSGIIFARTIQDLMKQNLINPEKANRLLSDIDEVTKAMPATLNYDFEAGHIDEIYKTIEELHKKEEDEGK